MAMIFNPTRSNRAMMSPMSPRSTPSCLTTTNVCSLTMVVLLVDGYLSVMGVQFFPTVSIRSVLFFFFLFKYSVSQSISFIDASVRCFFMVVTKGKKEVMYVFLLFLFSKVFSYASLLVFANLYVAAEYGAGAFAWSLFNIVLFITCLGLPDALVPWLLKKKDVRSVFSFLVCINLVVFIGGLLFMVFSSSYRWMLPLIILLPFMFLDMVARAVLKSQFKYHMSQLASNFFVMLTVVFAFFLKDFGKFGVTFAYSVAYLIPALWLVWLTRKSFYLFVKPRWDGAVIGEYVKKGGYTSLAGACFALLTWVDASLLGSLSTFENVARYSVAGALANLVAAVPLALSHFTLSRAAAVRSQEKSFAILSRTVRLSYALSLLVAITVVSLSFVLIRIFFAQYRGVELFVAVLCTGLLWYAVYSLVASFLVGRLQQEKMLFPIAVGALVNVVLDIVLIPWFGLYGIVLATLAGHGVAFIWLASKEQVKGWFLYFLIAPVFVLLAFFLRVYGLLLLPVAVGVLVWLRLITKEDIGIVLQVIRRVVRRA